MTPRVVVERRGGGGWIRLDKPEVLNSLDPEMVRQLVAAVDELEADPSVRALVLTGTGKGFCAGADLAFAGDAGDQAVIDAFLIDLKAAFDRVESATKPTIAAVNGVAVGGGFELLLCCDILVAAHGAKLGDGHANYGIVPGGGASARLPRKVPPNVAKHLMFTGELVDGPALERFGLVHRTVAPEELEAEVASLVASIAAKSPLGLRRMKELLDDATEQPLQVALRAELRASAEHRRSWDNAEGVRAFREKRPPAFEGR